ncbi:hypothetical protein ACJJIQ_16610 [Microbulbifer sp. ANSA003]|uniref:hypothetical protein n=1 Tax=Microbulbifer sp. ANSA003 TaxID=3243360 RepID=UPI00404274DF
MNEASVKRNVSRLVNAALAAITDKDPNFNRILISTSNELKRISLELFNAIRREERFSNLMAAGARGSNAFRARQSMNSRIANLSSLEAFLADEWKRLSDAVYPHGKKQPWEGKNVAELTDMLTGNIESFDKLLKKNLNQISQHLPNLDQVATIQNEVTKLKNISAHTAPSMIFLITISIRLFAMYMCSKQVTSNT